MLTTSHIDTALDKSLARAHRWKRMIESGKFASMTELSAAEKINRSYLCRILRLTLLAPDVVEATVDRRWAGKVQLAEMMGTFPIEWDRQRRSILGYT